MTTLRILLASLFAVAACGPSTHTNIIPTLPGDGSDNTARPGDGSDAPEPDPWEGRTDLIETPEAKPPAKLQLPPIERFTLNNGLEVIVVKSDELPTVSMQLAIKAGRADATRGRTGIERFAAALLTRGTKTRDALAIADAIDYVGGSMSATASLEATVINCTVLSKATDTCMTLLPDIAVNPTFPEEHMDEMRRLLQAEVRQRLDDAGALAGVHFQNLLWGEDHVRGWPMSMQSLASITRDELTAWHKKWFKPNNAVLAIAGDVDTKKLEKQLEKAFSTWKKGKVPERATYDILPLEGSRLRLVDKANQTQSHIRIGHYGISHKDPSFYSTIVFNYTLGGGAFASRLMKVVRSTGGKTYGASSGFDRNLERGAFAASTFTRSKETVATIKLMLGEIAKMQKEGPTADEVSDAITNITGSYATRFESAADIAGAVLGAELHGFDEKYVSDFALNIGAVTVESAKAAAAKNLESNNAVVVVVGDATILEPMFQAEGWVYEKIPHVLPVAGFERDPDLADMEITAEQAKEGKAILEKALKAKGGYAKVKAIKNFEMIADAQITGIGPDGKTQTIPAKLERRLLLPNQMRMDVIIGDGAVTVTTTLDKKKGWASRPDVGVVDLTDDQVAELTKTLWHEQELVLMRFKDKGARYAKLPDVEHDGTKYFTVALISPDNKSSVVLFIDKKTHLLFGMEHSEGGIKALQLFGDYKKVGGIQVAHARTLISTEQQLDANVTKIEFNTKIDKTQFDKPKK